MSDEVTMETLGLVPIAIDGYVVLKGRSHSSERENRLDFDFYWIISGSVTSCYICEIWFVIFEIEIFAYFAQGL